MFLKFDLVRLITYKGLTYSNFKTWGTNLKVLKHKGPTWNKINIRDQLET
jgi:hypothetical protein